MPLSRPVRRQNETTCPMSGPEGGRFVERPSSKRLAAADVSPRDSKLDRVRADSHRRLQFRGWKSAIMFGRSLTLNLSLRGQMPRGKSSVKHSAERGWGETQPQLVGRGS